LITRQNHKLVRKIKDAKFNVDNLHLYNLLLLIGPRDFQLAVTDRESNQCLLLEEYRFRGVKDYDQLIQILHRIFDDHHLLMAGFWKTVRVSIKNKKFTLVGSPLFAEENLFDYLSVNCRVNRSSEGLFYYKHSKTNAVNVFAANKKLIDWLSEIYQNLSIEVIHQGSALIEGVLTIDGNSPDQRMFLYIDRAVVHVIVVRDSKLEYYNQFTVKSPDEATKYILLVIKALGLDPNSSKVMVWGAISSKSSFYQLLYKYIKNISFGHKPPTLKFNYVFDEVLDHQYFDLYSMNLCD